jgi:hypothetical protein
VKPTGDVAKRGLTAADFPRTRQPRVSKSIR